MASPTPSLDSLRGSLAEQPRSLSPLEDRNSSPANGSSPTVSLSSSSSSGFSSAHNEKCPLCNENFTRPKVLPCFHTFCQSCLELSQEHPDKIRCAVCSQECPLNSQGIAGLITDFGLDPILDSEPSSVRCTGCKSRETFAIARCLDCENYLCANCMMAHQFMHCFEGHRVLSLTDLQTKEELKSAGPVEKIVLCLRHKSEPVKYYCRTCNIPICKECTTMEHSTNASHEWDSLAELGPKQLELLAQTMHKSKLKATDMQNSIKTLEHTSNKLQVQYNKAQNEINDTFLFYRSMLEERKQELLKELDSVYSTKQIYLNVQAQKAQDAMDKIYSTCDFVDRLSKHAAVPEVLLFKRVVESKLHTFMTITPDLTSHNGCEMEFVSNYQAIQVGVRNTFGYVRSGGTEASAGPSKQPPIARPVNGTSLHGNGTISTHAPPMTNGTTSLQNGVLERPFTTAPSSFESNLISKRFSSANSLGPFTSMSDLNLNGVNPYEKWSNGSSDSIYQNGGSVGNGGGSGGSSDHFTLSSGVPTETLLDLSGKIMSSTAIFPPKSQIKRQKMIYHCKFGEFGVMEGQFTEPSGVAVNAQNDIIVADTNNHRIQIFDKEGRFKFQFGECGKRDGQLLYPNRVAVVRTSGDIIVTERSPTHQIQIYNQYGQFVRKFGANILQHPRGVTVDNKGRIVVVECKVMRVIIFDQSGNVLTKFGCSKHLEFPNGVVVNDKQEIFISDNRAHCVKVFNYEGVYLRQIGGEGITNYPIGVGINSSGEILIADNHNNFNLTIFSQEGQLVSALESKVKHAQCFDVALMDDGSVVLASKDYRLYIYRYVQVPPMGI